MPTLTTLRRIPLARVGTWSASTGEWECTREQLADAVRAQEDPSFRGAVLKIGHTDPRFNAGDGTPAVGRVTNLALDEDGDVLVGDYEDIPAWLAEVAQAAYPSRSVEMNLGVQTVAGDEYAGVLTAVALLGVTPPAIENLDDIAALFGADVAASGEWTTTRTIAAAALPATTNGAPMPTTITVTPGPVTVKASADLDHIRTAYYEWLRASPDALRELSDTFVCEVWTDFLITDDYEGRFYRVPWSEADGTFTFGAAQRVTRTYTPIADTITARAAHTAHRPLRYFRGRDDVSASSPKETAPVADPIQTPQAPSLRERLGLAADASDEAVLTAIDELKAAKPVETPTPPAPVVPEAEVPVVPDTVPADLQTLVAAAVKAETTPLLEQVKNLSTELAARKADERVTRRETILAAALDAGKITPAQRDQFAAQYDAAPTVVESLLDVIAPGTAMPVKASGSVGSETTGSDDLYSMLYGTPKAGA